MILHLEENHSPLILINVIKLCLHVFILLPSPLLNDRPGEGKSWKLFQNPYNLT